VVKGKQKLVWKIENRKWFNLPPISNFHTVFQFPLTIFHFFLDLVFPRFCVGCGKEGDWICDLCQHKILQVKTQVCPDCGRISKFGRYCHRHQKRWGLSGVIVAAYYEEGPIKEAIHNLKYNDILELKILLGEILTIALKENLQLGQSILITAVPMHFLRRARRGYNQAEILADYIAQRLKFPKNFQILKKSKFTKTQVTVSGRKRRANLKNSFVFTGLKDTIKNKTIVIVDDVTTTGTTLNECAKVLREAGARRVWGLVIAKG